MDCETIPLAMKPDADNGEDIEFMQSFTDTGKLTDFGDICLMQVFIILLCVHTIFPIIFIPPLGPVS